MPGKVVQLLPALATLIVVGFLMEVTKAIGMILTGVSGCLVSVRRDTTRCQRGRKYLPEQYVARRCWPSARLIEFCPDMASVNSWAGDGV